MELGSGERRRHREQLAALRERGRVGDDGLWHFEEESDRWWLAQLERLVAELRAFADPETGLARGTVAPFGWGVGQRLAFARTVDELTVSGPTARAAWDAAIAAVADPDGPYGGLDLAPQRGLLPLGPDPRSGLQEVAHVASGAVPERGPGGRLAFDEGSALVLVLLPRSLFLMGAQPHDPAAPNYDPGAEENERPVHPVELAPYLVAKHELTQAQWERLAGANPSYYSAGGEWGGRVIEPTNPVEQVTWHDCMTLLGRHGLTLPTEAQWEHAARGDVPSPWWTGETVPTLNGAANVCVRYARLAGAP